MKKIKNSQPQTSNQASNVLVLIKKKSVSKKRTNLVNSQTYKLLQEVKNLVISEENNVQNVQKMTI